MIVGVVNGKREAVVGLLVRDAHGNDHDVDFVIDTGFTDFVTLPPSLIAQLGLTLVGRGRGILGSGAIHTFNVYAATIVWDGQPRTVDVLEADATPLVGMRMMENYVLRIEVASGGAVEISVIP